MLKMLFSKGVYARHGRLNCRLNFEKSIVVIEPNGDRKMPGNDAHSQGYRRPKEWKFHYEI